MKVAYITDHIYLQHDTGAMHPESPERLRAINKAIEVLHPSLTFTSPISAPEHILELVHSSEHIESIKKSMI